MDSNDIAQWLYHKKISPTPLIQIFSHYLTVPEAAQIFDQLQANWVRNGQVLWSGIPFEKAQEWADKHHLQTLTRAMGPLMDKKHTKCLISAKKPRQWRKYIHGASAIFAWHIARFEKVILLSCPPPQRLHPSGLSNYQAIEEPIIQGRLGHCAVDRIMMVHPTVPESEEVLYETWPTDRSSTWIKLYGLRNTKKAWRAIGQSRDMLRIKELATQSERRMSSADDAHGSEKEKVWPAYALYPVGIYQFTQDAPIHLFFIVLLFIFLLTMAKLTAFTIMGMLCVRFGKIMQDNKISPKIQVEGGPETTKRPNRAIDHDRSDRFKAVSDKMTKAKQGAPFTAQEKAHRVKRRVQDTTQEEVKKKSKSQNGQTKRKRKVEKLNKAKRKEKTEKKIAEGRKAKRKSRRKASKKLRAQKKAHAQTKTRKQPNAGGNI